MSYYYISKEEWKVIENNITNTIHIEKELLDYLDEHKIAIEDQALFDDVLDKIYNEVEGEIRNGDYMDTFVFDDSTHGYNEIIDFFEDKFIEGFLIPSDVADEVMNYVDMAKFIDDMFSYDGWELIRVTRFEGDSEKGFLVLFSSDSNIDIDYVIEETIEDVLLEYDLLPDEDF